MYDLYLRGLISRDASAPAPPGFAFPLEPATASQTEARVQGLLAGN